MTSKALESATTVASSSYHSEYGDIISIPGHIFTIPGKSIINLNVTYFKQVRTPGTNTNILAPISF